MLTSDDLIDMRVAILDAGGTIHNNSANNVIHAFNIFCMPPAWQTAQETAELVYIRRKYRNQTWTKQYGR